MTMETGIGLTDSERARYSRQIRLESFGEASQLKLKSATALISRVGGVGGTAAMNLVRAGIGRVILAHHGPIVPEYLNRMQLVEEADVGKPLVSVWARRLKAINSAVEVVEVPEYMSDATAEKWMKDCDVVVDGAPLFEERYAMQRAAVRLNKPLCMGAMFAMEGYASTFIPGQTPCLSCIYPVAPEYWKDISVFPAMGPVPVMVGTTIALEAIKVLTGFGETLANKLWYFDASTHVTRLLKIRRRDNCEVCGHLH
jgi:molybdopterin/thiamine biosynthesis adenylyltransferase